MKITILLFFCYILGSIPFAYILGQIFGGVDIRKKGSGNVGATNVLRTLGKGPALIAATGDILKGMIAAWLGHLYGGETMAAACALTAVIGHCWSVFLRFRGGKGVATAAGSILYLMPQILILLLSAFVIVIFFSRLVSLGSIIAAALFPIFTWMLFDQPWPYKVMSLIVAFIVIIRHRENIQRLYQGNEKKIGQW